MMNRYLLVLCLIICLSLSFAVNLDNKSYPFKDCSQMGKVSNIRLTGCDSSKSTADNCVVSVGNQVSISITLAMHKQYNDLQLKFTAGENGKEIPLQNSDVCKSGALNCKAQAGQPVVLNFKNSVPKQAAHMNKQRFYGKLTSASTGQTPICFSLVMSVG